MELQRHIEILLLENDCVIVPDFGGFMAHRVPAHYDQSDRMFLPPRRTLGFNPQLNINDSLLVQSYVEAYDISYPEALRRIESEVSLLKHQLSEDGIYPLDGLGTLKVNQEGRYEFEPCDAGILSPSLYGLGSFAFKQLHDDRPIENTVVNTAAAPLNEQPALAVITEAHDDEDDRAIEIKMSWIRNTIAVAAAVAAFFLMATPIANSDLGTQSMSQLRHNILYRLMPKDTNAIPDAEPLLSAKESAKNNTAEAALVEAKFANKEVTATKQESKPAEQAAPQKAQMTSAEKPASITYCIVVASQVKRHNADLFVEQLHKQGYSEARVYVSETIRVICGEYNSEAEAYRHLNKLQAKEGFEEAWVYKKHN